MVKVSYAITVCNEVNEIKRLLTFLTENIRSSDEIVILFDERNGDMDLLDYLLEYNKLSNVQVWRSLGFNNNFADWKNKLNEYCSGNFILQLDADEMINPDFIEMLPILFELNPEVELYYLPRINTVEGITEDHIQKWGWKKDEKNRINYPDYQGRLHKKGLKWDGNVHERIIGAKYYSILPDLDVYSIIHHKTIEKQEQQNNFYSKLI